MDEQDGKNSSVDQDLKIEDVPKAVKNFKKGQQPTTAGTEGDKSDSLSDAGKWAFTGLAANILADYYGSDYDKNFRKSLLDELMASIDLPEQNRAPQHAVANGEFKTEPDPFIDTLMEEELVQKTPEALLTSLLLVAIKGGDYDARVRVVIEQMCWLLRVDMSQVEVVEEQLLSALKNQAELSEEEKKKAAVKSRNSKIKRGVLIGLATVVGGTLIGVTGGLAAPLIATGVGAIIGTAGGAALGSVAGVAVIGSLFGVAGAGLTGYKMKKRVGGIEEFEFDVLSEGDQMHITIAISGWITKKGNDGFRTPWMSMDNCKEQYYLRWESSYLQDLGKSLDYLYNMMMKQAITETLKYTALSTLLTAIAWPATLLSLANIIDNPWNVATQRAENTGKQLAQVLLTRQQGHRPVTLVGFSLGARVIFYCLRELAQHPKGAGIVENAYLLGAPVSGSPKEWEPLAKVVAGRVVNAYIKTASVQFNIAGTGPVLWENRRMVNMDLTNVVNGHMDYMKKMETVLDAVGIKTKTVHNHFITHSDSGYSTSNSLVSAANGKTVEKTPLVENAEAAEDLLALDTGALDKPLTPQPAPSSDESVPLAAKYEKLDVQGSADSLDDYVIPLSRLLLTGETTDSNNSLPEKLHYTQLTDDASSSQDSVDEELRKRTTKGKHKKKTKCLVERKPLKSEQGGSCLLGEVSIDRAVLNADSSDDSILKPPT